MTLFQFAILFSSVSFFGYGVGCLATSYMKREFERYGLAGLRQFTGALEIAGAAGLVLGFRVPIIGCLSAGGLALLMFFGFLVRLKIKDGPLRAFPALLYLGLNLYLFREFLIIL
jgi:hypothetical protein